MKSSISTAPKGLALLAMLGPSFIWVAEYIGSGEVILATRTGAILGTTVIWAVVIGIFLKFWIGLSGARYTVATGEGMIDLFARMPGPKNWAVWLVLVAQFITATIAIGSLASAAGIFVNELFPLTSYSGGWIITILALIMVWSGQFNKLKIMMSLFILVIVVGVGYVAIHTFPGLEKVLEGLMLKIPSVPEWASHKGASANPWEEILPLLGWGAGGFASQVWYSYWVLGAGYGAARGKKYGESADLTELKNYNLSDAQKIKGWFKVVYTDASLGMIIGILVTTGFLIAGATILNPRELAPEGANAAITLSHIFSQKWGEFGATVFITGAAIALLATQVGQMAGWPRLLADTFRICIPSFNRKLSWKWQFRSFLLFFFAANMIIVYTLGIKPVFLVKMSAILDGLLLTPLQAIWVGLGLFLIMPKLYKPEVAKELRPHWIFAAGLIIAFLVFGYFCVFQIPKII